MGVGVGVGVGVGAGVGLVVLGRLAGEVGRNLKWWCPWSLRGLSVPELVGGGPCQIVCTVVEA